MPHNCGNAYSTFDKFSKKENAESVREKKYNIMRLMRGVIRIKFLNKIYRKLS